MYTVPQKNAQGKKKYWPRGAHSLSPLPVSLMTCVAQGKCWEAVSLFMLIDVEGQETQ